MKLNTDELLEITQLLLKYLNDTERTEFEIDDDFYWWIDEDELYNPLEDPGELSLGQLSDDWARLKSIQSGDDPPIGFALVWLSAILRRVGEKTVH